MSEINQPTSKRSILLPTLIIIVWITIIFGMFLCYVWANDLAIHLIYIEQLIQNLHKPLPENPSDYI